MWDPLTSPEHELLGQFKKGIADRGAPLPINVSLRCLITAESRRFSEASGLSASTRQQPHRVGQMIDSES
jgi:hypothetical protein